MHESSPLDTPDLTEVVVVPALWDLSAEAPEGAVDVEREENTRL